MKELPELPYKAEFFKEDFCRGEGIKLFKHRAGLYSDEPADPEDEIVDICIMVFSKPKMIVRFPVTREHLKEPDFEKMMLTRAIRWVEARKSAPSLHH